MKHGLQAARGQLNTWRLLLALAVLPLAASDAQAHERHGGGQRPIVELSAVIDSKVRNERLPLRRILGIGPRFEGSALRAVDIELRPRGRTTRFLLLADDEVIGEAWSRHGDDFVRIEPWQRVRIGRDVQRVQLAVEGSARIERVSALLRKPRHGHGHRHGWRHWSEGDDWRRGEHGRSDHRAGDAARAAFKAIQAQTAQDLAESQRAQRRRW